MPLESCPCLEYTILQLSERVPRSELLCLWLPKPTYYYNYFCITILTGPLKMSVLYSGRLHGYHLFAPGFYFAKKVSTSERQPSSKPFEPSRKKLAIWPTTQWKRKAPRLNTLPTHCQTETRSRLDRPSSARPKFSSDPTSSARNARVCTRSWFLQYKSRTWICVRCCSKISCYLVDQPCLKYVLVSASLSACFDILYFSGFWGPFALWN